MAFKPNNPFLLTSYAGPEYFCDREKETDRLLNNLLNGVNTTLLSVRRMGKTGLLKHVSYHLREQKVICIYIDIYATQNLREFTIALLNGIWEAVPSKSSFGKQFMAFIKNIRAIVSFDPVSGQPQLSLEMGNAKTYAHSLATIFQLLEKQQQPLVVLIDEFQQIDAYPEKTVEALLRTHIQQLQYTHFVFSGSNKHLLTSTFGDIKRPFYMSTQLVDLKPIEAEAYSTFIRRHFEAGGKQLSDDALNEILRFSKRHTYYTQAVCNRLYAQGPKKPEITDVLKIGDQLLLEQEAVFFQYRQLLTPAQWRLLGAIAVEEKVYNPTAGQFLKHFELGAASAVQRSLAALEQKEMIFKENNDKGSFYQVYDCFLSRWLEKSTYSLPPAY